MTTRYLAIATVVLLCSCRQTFTDWNSCATILGKEQNRYTSKTKARYTIMFDSYKQTGQFSSKMSIVAGPQYEVGDTLCFCGVR